MTGVGIKLPRIRLGKTQHSFLDTIIIFSFVFDPEDNGDFVRLNFRLIIGVRTCDVFLCYATIVRSFHHCLALFVLFVLRQW